MQIILCIFHPIDFITIYLTPKETMSWVLQKILASRLRKYFQIENDGNIELSLLNKRELKCRNLMLKTQVINKPSMPILIKQCRIGLLQLCYNSKQNDLKKPLNIRIDRVKLTVALNTTRQPQEPESQGNRKKQHSYKKRPVLEQFYKAVGSEQQYQQRNFIQEQFYQLKQMLTESMLGGLYINITNVDVAVEYVVNKIYKYFGMQIEQIEAKQVFNVKGLILSQAEKHKAYQLIGQVKQLKIYFGIGVNQQVGFLDFKDLQKIKINKRYILEKCNLSALYNLPENNIEINCKQISVQMEDILLYEGQSMAKYFTSNLNMSQDLRPGQGFTREVVIHGQTVDITEGTLKWWQKVGDKVINILNRKNRYGLFDSKYRRYLYCILYRYTYGAHPELEKIVDQFQYFKTDRQILLLNKLILSKIHKTQIAPREEDIESEDKITLLFLLSYQKNNTDLKKYKLKKISIQAIKKSDIIINYRNCKKFIKIKQAEQINCLAIGLKIGRIGFGLRRCKFFNLLQHDLQNLTPVTYQKQKNSILEFFCNQSINNYQNMKTNNIQGQKQGLFNTLGKVKQAIVDIVEDCYEKLYLSIQIKSIQMDYNSQGSIHLNMLDLTVTDVDSRTLILKVSDVACLRQKMHPEVYGYKMTAEKCFKLNVEMVFVFLEIKFVQKMLTILSYVQENSIETVQQQPQPNFVSRFIQNKVPNHPIFNKYEKDSVEILLRKIIIATPVFDSNKTFEINLKGIRYDDDVDGNPSFGIEQSLILRSNCGNLQNKVLSPQRQPSRVEDEVVIMGNTRQFSGTIEKNGVKSMTNLVVPFILIQLSCQDVFYLMNIINIWKKRLINPFYFPPRKTSKKARASSINQCAVKFAQLMVTVDPRKYSQDILLEGIQFCLLSDYVQSGRNVIFDLLIDNVSLVTYSEYLEEKFSVKIRDIFVRNLIGSKQVNKQSLVKSVKEGLKIEDDPILYIKKNKQSTTSEQNNPKIHENQELLLYVDASTPNNSKIQEPFFRMQKNSKVDLSKRKRNVQTDIKIVPLYLFYSLQFTQTLSVILSIIGGLSVEVLGRFQKQNKAQLDLLPFSFTHDNLLASKSISQKVPKQQDHQMEVLAPEQFRQLMNLNVSIKRFHLLAVKNYSVVYTISIFDISVTNATEPYVQKFFFDAQRLVIVDTNDQAGQHQTIIDLKADKKFKYAPPFRGSYTTYNSEIIKFRENKSAFFELKMQGCQITFLKKKVMELLNFMLMSLKQLGILAKPGDQVTVQPKPSTNQFPLRYRIVLKDTIIDLFRSSLSDQVLKSTVQSIQVTNYKSSNQEDQKTSEAAKFSDNRSQKSFYDLNGSIGQIEYQSFMKQAQQKQSSSIIYIGLKDMKIYGTQTKQKQAFLKQVQLLSIPQLYIEYFSPQMDVKIPQMSGDFYDQDFRVLIRMTQENLTEVPLLFVDNSQVQKAVKMSFLTTFGIQKTEICVNIMQDKLNSLTQKTHKKVYLKFYNIDGKNQLWSNSQNITQLTMSEMKIYTKKYDDFHSYEQSYEDDEQNQSRVTIIKKLKKENIGQMPQLAKSCQILDVSNYRQLEVLQKELRRKLLQILKNEVQKVELFGSSADKDAYGGQNIKQDTNTEKIGKWLRGMFEKCCKCCKKQQPKVMQQFIQDIMLHYIEKKCEVQMSYTGPIILEDNKYKDRMAPMIYRIEDVLDFDYGLDQKQINRRKKEDNMVYLSFVIKPNGQKQMYTLVKKIEVLLQNSKALIGLSQFFARPYSTPDIPQSVRKYKFNNNKPFKMLIQVDDALAQIKHVNQDKTIQRICILSDLIYDTESRGDLTMGPGLSKMNVQTVAKVLFMSEKLKKGEAIDLSDEFKIAYYSETRIPYGDDQRNECIQKIMMAPNEKNDWNVSFYVPAFALKAVYRILMSNMAKISKQDEKQHKSQVNDLESPQPASMLKNKQKINKKSLPIQHIIDKEQDQKPTKKAATSTTPNLTTYQARAPLKLAPAAPSTLKQSHMFRTVYISQITFQIQSNLKNCFITSKIRDLSYSQLYVNNRANKLNTRTMITTIDVKYWNLKLGVYEPAIEPWRFRMQQVVHERDKLSSSNLKIMSQLDKWKMGDQRYTNDLNVNVSMALYQTFKELMIVYEQEKYDDNEECIDLTQGSKICYDYLFGRPVVEEDILKYKLTKFPNKLVKYFTRSFFVNNKALNLKKYDQGKIFYNAPNLHLELYHSYFDHFRRKKFITKRTPYRILNSTNLNLTLWFYDCKKKIIIYQVPLNSNEHFAIPSTIYHSDFMVHVSDWSLEKFDQKTCPLISVRYLIQLKARKRDFKKVQPESIVWKNIFKYSSTQTQKQIDPRAFVLDVGGYNLAVVNVLSKHQPKQQQVDSKYPSMDFYDSFCILHSPLMIDNYTYQDMQIKINRNIFVKIPKNQRVQINQQLPSFLHQTLLQFTNDNIHAQHSIFQYDIGNHNLKMEINNLQSIKLQIIRETNCLCLIKLYTEWNIVNYTHEVFWVKNSQKLVLIDQMSFNSMASMSKNGIDICIIDEDKYKVRLKQNNFGDVVTLAKQSKKLKQQLQHVISARDKINKSRCCICSNSAIYEHIEFIFSASEDPIDPFLCQKVQIRYRYQIVNKTSSMVTLCQYDSSFVIAEMLPFSKRNKITPQYIFYYDFVPREYFFEIQELDARQSSMKALKSCTFNLDRLPGSSFVIKIKKNTDNLQLQEYQNRFFYYFVQIKKYQQETIIQISNTNRDSNNKNFPIYIQNATTHQIKISQGEDEFVVKPDEKICFAWTNLNPEQYRLTASVNGEPGSQQIYEFNNKCSFEPIKISDKSKKRRKKLQGIYLRQNCYVVYKYYSINSTCMIILDMFDSKLRIHNKQLNINTEIDMKQVKKLQPLASKIEIQLQNNDIIELIPSSRTISNWVSKLQSCMNEDVVEKIHFTIESLNNSRIFLFSTAGEQEYQSYRNEISIAHLNVSVISNTPEQVILLYCGDMCYIQHNKKNKMNFENLQLSQSETIITIKKVKISNQTRDGINPVIMSEIKKSNYPFIELRLVKEKLHLAESIKGSYTTDEQLQLKELEQKITHFREILFFMDEAEIMVEAALFLKIFGVKKNFDYITNQYAVGSDMSQKDMQIAMINDKVQTSRELGIDQIRKTLQHNKMIVRTDKDQKYPENKRISLALVRLPQKQEIQKTKPQIYINYLEIKPLKLTISVFLDNNGDENEPINLIRILRYIPFGIQNAIVEIESYQFFHVFYDNDQLSRQLLNFYKKQAWNQIYKNAGSYDMFVPIQFIGGVGSGVKKIFYDPIYELVKKKEIKAVGKTFCQGLLSFIVFLFSFLFKIINLVFKIIAIFTFDQRFKIRRESFRKQIFKSPVEGAVLGGKNFLQVFKSIFNNFKSIPKDYAGYLIFGYLLGFIICILKIIPWTIKLVVSLYDWIYVIGLGLVNWGYYEISAMRTRSRPRRMFFHKQIVPYNYLQSLGNEIITSNQLPQVQNQQVFFIKSVQHSDDSNYLILSNYRIIHSYHKLSSMKEIKLYQLSDIQTVQLPDHKKYGMTVNLSIPNIHKVLFLFSYNVSHYSIKFLNKMDAVEFLKLLKHLCMHEKLNVRFVQSKELDMEFDSRELMLLEVLDQRMDEIKARREEHQGRERDRRYAAKSIKSAE